MVVPLRNGTAAFFVGGSLLCRMADGPMSRRDFVKAAVITASGAALGVGAFSTFIPAFSGRERVPMPILRGTGEGASEPMTLQDLEGPPVVAVVGQWNYLPAIVMKVPKAALAAAAERRGYNTGQYALQHPMESGNVVLAYDAKCTHLGCTVGFNPKLGASRDVVDYDGDSMLDGRLICPCHQSQFDVFDLARNLPGMPAQRPLDAMEIRFGATVDGSPSLEGLRRIRQSSYRAADADGDGAGFRLAG